MYPYTKELTLDKALNILLNAKCQSYENDGKVYLTALDYATYILKQAAPPEGWGYAAYDLDSGRYHGLECYGMLKDNTWSCVIYTFDNGWNWKWNLIAFRLTDLARVEAESEILQPATCCPKCYEVMTELKQEIADLEAKNKELKETKDPFEEQFEQIAANQKLNRLHSKIEWQNQIIEKYSELIELYKQAK